MNLLQLASQKVSSSEVYEISAEETQVLISGNKLKEIKNVFSQGVALRIIHNGKIGFASTTNLKNPNKILESAISSSDFGEIAKFEFPKSCKKQNVDVYDKKIENLSYKDMIKLAKETIEILKEKIPKIHCDIQVAKEMRKITLSNSNGFYESYNKSIFLFNLFCILTKPQSLIQVYDVYVSTKLKLNVLNIANKIIKKIKLADREYTIPSGKFTCVFTPRSLLHIGEGLRLGINGKLLQKKISPLLNKLNKKIFSDKLTIIDDATLPNFSGSYPFDDEGSPSLKNTIVEKGILKSYLSDLQTSSILNISLTSSGKRRNIFALPSPDVSNIIINPGDISIKDIIKNIKEGLLIDQIIGWASNPLAGEFSGNIELGYKIEKGKIIGRVKNCVLSGNIYQDFNKISAISKEQEMVFGSLLAPYILIEDISISGI